jgi:hypothetical protein
LCKKEKKDKKFEWNVTWKVLQNDYKEKTQNVKKNEFEEVEKLRQYGSESVFCNKFNMNS